MSAELLPLIGIALLVFVIAALVQAVTGFGSVLAAVPGLLLVTDPARAVVVATIVSWILTTAVALRERAHVDRRDGLLLTLTGIVGMPVGLVLLAVADERRLSAGIAVVMLVLVLLMAIRPQIGRRGMPVAGIVSGVLLTSTGMNGPPLVMALVDREPRRYRATLQAVFAGQDLVAVAAFLVLGHIDSEVLLLSLGGVAGLPVGWRLGDALFRRVSPAQLRPLVIATLVISAAAVLVSAVM
ncbi:sulfite exporter TauE/SafE family protein [Nocardioides sp. NPDC101246]|uniref:sulfite exporter TauE/SafE family protein n=1 Tax=Nocardioides sp. NPDC101246 TaxID=3364336 RepID=UPI0038017C26